MSVVNQQELPFLDPSSADIYLNSLFSQIVYHEPRNILQQVQGSGQSSSGGAAGLVVGQAYPGYSASGVLSEPMMVTSPVIGASVVRAKNKKILI